MLLSRKPTPVASSQLLDYFLWTRPFSLPVWMLLLATACISAFFMGWYEHQSTASHLQRTLSDARRAGSAPWAPFHRATATVGYNLYVSVGTFATNNSEGFNATTLPGRIYRSFFSMAILITIATYVANLAAILSRVPDETARVQSLADFALLHSNACVQNASDAVTSFMKAYYPRLPLHTVNSDFASDMARAVLSPSVPCAGAIVPEARMRYALSAEGDPAGEFCDLEITGEPLGYTFAAIPFSNGVAIERRESLNKLVVGVMSSGAYSWSVQREVNFPLDRPQCASRRQPFRHTPGTLSLREFSGVFLLVALGLAISLIAKLGQMVHGEVLRRSREGARRRREGAAAVAPDGVVVEADEEQSRGALARAELFAEEATVEA